ncbi:tRNA (guanine-N(7)-)-methyltransferase non-catalytic subunit wdr4-like isoform X2 [Ruditapes philippinarum]|uniref:tRNA (guanine-N(7)-)-methyltransferase non-catalytic subunit wdr4-like isoform X2 n=1 Tax=Ruditapes philippinarum TaxID=129788 RepID=UPI00295BF9E6|nr:tRNA (guanine-N(7)-)-methyltransferase non-catalytic subunit wdr4-like isoform X2 [Ruditapes philippinarum]
MATLRRNRETFVFMSGDSFISSNKCETEKIKIPDIVKEPKDEEKPQRLVPSRCTAITFPQNEKEVVVADRTGDVYKFSLIDTSASGELILGHLSLILDIAMSSDDKYIITCDRDEKIRISHYPNAYNIHAYCLLHSECVSQVLYLKEFSCLVSGSGDGTLASWTLDGKNICQTNTVSHTCKKGQGDTNSKNSSVVPMVTNDVCQGQGQDEGQGQGEGQTEVDGQNELPGVKKMIYSQELNVIAVIYYGLKQLNFFSVEEHKNGCTLTENSHNTLTEEPWDICFGDHHSVWILQHCEEKPVLVYECTKDSRGNIQVNERIADQTQKLLCDKWSFFKASIDCPKLSMRLQKIQPHNNVQKYLEKKEERINAQKNKQQPPQKKLKTS